METRRSGERPFQLFNSLPRTEVFVKNPRILRLASCFTWAAPALVFEERGRLQMIQGLIMQQPSSVRLRRARLCLHCWSDTIIALININRCSKGCMEGASLKRTDGFAFDSVVGIKTINDSKTFTACKQVYLRRVCVCVCVYVCHPFVIVLFFFECVCVCVCVRESVCDYLCLPACACVHVCFAGGVSS